MKIDEWFQQFQCIDLPKIESKWNKKKIQKKHLENFVSQVESLLSLLEKLLKQYTGGSNNISKSWPTLFHSRMLLASDTLNFKAQRHLNNILSLYLKYSNKKEKFQINTFIQNEQYSYPPQHPSQPQATQQQQQQSQQEKQQNEEKHLLNTIAESMLEYMSTHYLDPDNSLIGYYAHPNLVDLFVQQQKYRKIRAIPSNQDLTNKSSTNIQAGDSTYTSLITTLPVIQNLSNNGGVSSIGSSSSSSQHHHNTSKYNSNNLKSLKNAYHYIGAEITGFNSSPISSASSSSSTSSSSSSYSSHHNHHQHSSSNTSNISNQSTFSHGSWKKKKELSVEYLLDLIENWSKMKNREISEEVKEFLRSKDKLGIFKGDLVIIKTNNKDNMATKYMFARFNGQVCDSFANTGSKRYSSSQNMEYLSVYVNAQESEWVWVARDDVYKFSRDMMDNLSSSRRIATLIECPSYKLQKIIQIKEIEYLRDYLEKNSISPVLLDKLENQTVTLRDLRELRSMGLILSQLSNNLPHDLVLSIQKMVSAEVGRFLSQMDPLSIYPPTKKDFLETLDKYPMTRPSHLKTHASYLKVHCETTISKLISQKLEILDGSRKIKVVNWWLNLIKDQVDEYLIERGFDPKAVPTNYTQSPPQNIQKVAHNLLVLHNVLPSAGSFDPSILDLIKKLKDEIYPVIQDFNQNIKFILYEWLDIPIDNIQDFNTDLSSSPTKSTAEQVQIFYQYLEKNSVTLSPENISKIKRMIKDIEYLTEMINLESSISEFSLDDDRRFETHTDIIPISGLIFGRLFRIENESRTVLECWRDPKIKISPIGNISPRSRTIDLGQTTPIPHHVHNTSPVSYSSSPTLSTPPVKQDHKPRHSIPEIIVDTCQTPPQPDHQNHGSNNLTCNTIVSNCTTSMNVDDQLTNEISDVNESIASQSFAEEDYVDDDDIEEEEEYKKPSFSKSPSLQNALNQHHQTSEFIDEACTQLTIAQQINRTNQSTSSIETVIFNGKGSIHQISASLVKDNLLHRESSDILKKSSSTTVSTSLPNLSTLSTEYDHSKENLNFMEPLGSSTTASDLSFSTPIPIVSPEKAKQKKKRFWAVPFFSNLMRRKSTSPSSPSLKAK
ncbi:hypothetical protein DLAC_11223 [Tieghemostelium lacteum]|uniref:Uncharacterized protein n=1 Tax=Tieghemostelium lacteum TaxID=361077 RepID=A0A151Z3I7_TIELA|nr:hypothetical protein DLAC_11223 [Tieghemostelium lacteum]|eukprot:KYQ88505.1 hypothetical protein DLAC_11223 [Tieghemostelium lacteum]